MSFMNSKLSLLFLFSFFFPYVNSLFFNFSSFKEEPSSLIECRGDAFIHDGTIKLTKSMAGANLTDSVGRAVYKKEVLLWNEETRELADFTNHFSFNINCLLETNPNCGDGLTFFLAKYTEKIPDGSGGNHLGLYGPKTDFNITENGFVAVEFDTYRNYFDPQVNNHVGIDINSVVSVATISLNDYYINGGRNVSAWVTYNSSTKNLSVFLTYDENPSYKGNPILSYLVDLRDYLPSKVVVGFSASTGSSRELHEIVSWSFASTLEEKIEEPKMPEKPENPERKRSNVGVTVGIAASFGTIMILLSGAWFVYRCKKARNQEDSDIEMEFEKEKGPQRYTFDELVAATNNFAVERRLGEGGFGEVYKGVLNNEEVAIKRISSGSQQGKKEFTSEVRIISRLRHRNLVQLVGWCHQKREFLLVYKYMTNGSLDYRLYDKEKTLSWPVRYNIALGLASSLLYLHEEWEQCVVHRDVKPSNVMLDTEFEAKLGDFGLARLVDHEIGSQTTILAGTMGYLAPESFSMGRARKESDVYSFGIVALEIACGRKPMASGSVTLVRRVWELYGHGMILDAVDQRLGIDFDQDEIERLMVVGLWCAHPNHELRPSIRQAINVLKLEAPLPSLPPTMPVPMFVASPSDMGDLFSTDGSYPASTTASSIVASSGSSATSLLKSYKSEV